MKIRYRFLLTGVCTLFSLISFAQLKINSSGYVGINNDSPAYRLDVNGDGNFAGNVTCYGVIAGTVQASTSLRTSGYIESYGDIAGAYGYFVEVYTSSDERIKTNIVNLPSSTNKLFSLRPVNYNLLKESQTSQGNRLHYGFIAQEVKEIFPDLVSENKDSLMAINYTALIPMLVQALKEQNDKIKSLEDRIVKLENVSK